MISYEEAVLLAGGLAGWYYGMPTITTPSPVPAGSSFIAGSIGAISGLVTASLLLWALSPIMG